MKQKFNLALSLAVIFSMLLSSVALAKVWTDQEDYTPGSTVTISGGNDENGAPGYVPGAPVTVAVTGPHDPAYESTTCDNVVAGDGGSWSCTLTLWTDPEWAVGTYNYTATSAAADGSPIEETGTFTDTRTITAVTLTAGGVTVPQLPSGPYSLTVRGGATISAKVTVYLTSIGDKSWGSTAWAITNDPLALLLASTWTCKDTPDHAAPTSYPWSGTYNETFNITAPSTAGTYTAYFLAFAGNSCVLSYNPLPSNMYFLVNSIVVKPTLYIVPDAQTVTYGDSAPSYTFKLYTDAAHTSEVTDTTTIAGYTAPTCGSDYTTTTSVANSPRTISCGGGTNYGTAGAATDYFFDYSATANLTINKAAGSVTINNIPVSAVYGGSFTPTFTLSGDGAASVASNTIGTCTVTAGVVSYVGAGTCKLQASVAEGTDYLAATGAEQSFTIGKAAGSVSINNIPGSALYGGSFTPTFTKLGDGTTSVASLTTSTCTVTAGAVSFIDNGTCTLQASVTEGTNYLAATGSSQSFTIGTADATPTYTSFGWYSTLSPTSSSFKVLLSATVVVTSGDVRTATVTFKSGTTTLCGPVAVGLVDPNNLLIGAASCYYINSLSGTYPINITVVVGGNYTGTSDPIPVTITKPALANFMSGGGYLVLTDSSGAVPGADGSKMNFGYTFKYNKGGSNPQGKLIVILRASDGNHYQIKTTSITSLYVKPIVPKAKTTGIGTLTAKAVITNLTTGQSVDGQFTLKLSTEDNGEPGGPTWAADKLYLVIFNDAGGIWFSSHWSGSATIVQAIEGGNLQVH